MSETTGMQRFRVEALGKTYQTRNGTRLALTEVEFGVNDHEIICIVGPSGCGKTSLLKIIAGLLKPSTGRIVFHPSSKGHLRTALVFQEHGLFPWMTTLENIAFGLEMCGVARDVRLARAQDFCQKVGLTGFAHSFPHELSIGMQQRVGIARAFVADPDILLMDEPFGSLDSQTRQVLHEELLRIWSQDQKTIVFVTHDIEEAILLGDRVLVMTGRPGKIREEIPISLSRPRGLDEGAAAKMTEIKWHIWKMLEKEVRQSLSIPLEYSRRA